MGSASTAMFMYGATQASTRRVLKNMNYKEMETWLHSCGQKKTRAMQLWKSLYGKGKWVQSADEMVGVSGEFKRLLSEVATFDELSLDKIHKAADGTRKMLFSVGNNETIETVVIPELHRNTVCISSQVGCAMNCQFCFTGRMGLKRQLSTAQIVDQFIIASRTFSQELGPMTNVVFMGMGEPLNNISNVLKALEIMVDLHGIHLGPRKVTVSTSGLVPEIRRFYREAECGLAVSLNATTDEVRDLIMPINRKYNLNTLLSTLREELARKKHSMVFFEYVLLSGVNDSLDDATRLINLVEGIPCKINLIKFNAHQGSSFQPSSNQQMVAFKDRVAISGLRVTMRRSRGDDQMAACGQLGKNITVLDRGSSFST